MPSPKALSSDSDVLVSSSSFKPLNLTSHPWVRAHLRPSRDPQKPRLSFLAQHCHMYGPESFSQPEGVTRVVSGAGIRRSGEGLEEALGNASETPTPSASTSTGYFDPRAPNKPACSASMPHPPRYSRHREYDVSPDADAFVTPEIQSNMACHVPEPGPPPPHPSSAPLHGSHRTQSKRHRKKPPSTPPLGLAEIPDAFVGVLSASDNIFGPSVPIEQKPVKRKRKRTGTAEDMEEDEEIKLYNEFSGK